MRALRAAAGESGTSEGGVAGVAEPLRTNKVSVQFTYPFKVGRWEALRHGLTGFLDELGHELHGLLPQIQDGMDQRFGEGLVRVFDADTGAVGRPHKRERRRVRPTDCDASILAAIRKYIGQDVTSTNHAFQVSDEPICFELIDLLKRIESRHPEKVMGFLRDKLDSSRVPLLRPAEFHVGDDRGTRAYLERKRPFIEAKLAGVDLQVVNPDTVPDIARKLPRSDDAAPGVRLTASLRLMSSGFGCVALEARLMTERGLLEWIDEIVYQGEPKVPCSAPTILATKARLTENLRPLLLEAVRTRDPSKVETVVEGLAGELDSAFVHPRLKSLLDGATLVSDDLVAEDIIDVANLDRGYARGREPRFSWSYAGERLDGRMVEYYKFLTDELFLAGLAESVSADPSIREYMAPCDRRCDRTASQERHRNELTKALSHLSMDSSSYVVDEHPYVSTFLSAPAPLKEADETDTRPVAERFSSSLGRYREDLIRILMKSKWVGIRHDWVTTSKALDNLFYSDLIYMAVDIRSTLCVYYVPTNAEEYTLIPELAHGYKYLVELNETLQEQRMLWYTYTAYDYVLTQDFRSIAASLDGLQEETLKERFSEVMAGLADIIRGIDRSKMALAETIHDPLSRKAGSSLFSRMIEKTNEAFQLGPLYENLQDKLERLDMLGIHVAENVQLHTSLVVQEGTRAALLTLEFLEAFIIAFYFTELVHLSLSEAQREQRFATAQWWSFYAVFLGVFLATLPVITLVRRTRSRFALTNPGWLDWLEHIGILLGPAVLLGMVFVDWAFRASPHAPGGFALIPGAWRGLVLLLPAYLAIAFGWHEIERRAELKRT